MYLNVTQRGNKILVREFVNGEEKRYRTSFSPTLFIPKEHGEYQSIHGDPLNPMKFDEIAEAKDFMKSYNDVSNFRIYGMENFALQYMVENFSNVSYDAQNIRIANLDIEVHSDSGFPEPAEALYPVTAITIYDNIDDTYYVWGQHPKQSWCAENSELDPELVKKVVYTQCLSEADLLLKFLNHWRADYPVVMTGWNIEGFDIPYLVNRIERILGEGESKKLSPWNAVDARQVKGKFGKESTTYKIIGISNLDYLAVYQKHTFENQERYSLDHIAYVELKENKLSYEEFQNLRKLYNGNFQKYIDYNIKDVELVQRLDDKLKLFDLVFDIAYFSLINYDETFSPVKTWDSIIYANLIRKKIVVPFTKRNIKEPYPGAYVKVPKMGMMKWVVSFDLASLYPSIIRQWNLGPETLRDSTLYGDHVEKLLTKQFDTSEYHERGESVAGNGVSFDISEQSFLSELMEWLYNERASAKNESKVAKKAGDESLAKKKNVRQQALKVLLNSAYGALGNIWFRFYDLRLASAITLSGQLAIKWIAQKLDDYFNKLLKTEGEEYVIYIDTDSVYLNLEKFVDKYVPNKTTAEKVDFLDKACKKIEEYIGESYQELKDYVNAREQLMIMDREAIGDRGFWTAKKRYAINVHDMEGYRYPEPQLKIMGLEIVKKDTPEVCRGKLKECVRIMLQDGDNAKLIKYVDKFHEEFKQLPPSSFAITKSVSYLRKYADPQTIYIKGVPYNSRGSLIYNHLKEKHNLVDYEKIEEGDKIKILYLKTPNHIHENLICFPQELPKEFGLDEYIDHDEMFFKGFMNPLKGMTDSIGWKTEESFSLDDLF